MKVQICKRQAVCSSLPKYGYIVLLLAVFVLILILIMKDNMDTLEIKLNSKIFTPSVSPVSYTDHGFCNFLPLSPKDALEEEYILKSIAWPETPPLPSPFSQNKISDPAHSIFTIVSGRGGGQWHVGDKLEVMVKMYDSQRNPKKYGGDVLLARLHNPALGAGVAGQVKDHLNGSYSAVFSLLWEGSAQVEVMLKFIIFKCGFRCC